MRVIRELAELDNLPDSPVKTEVAARVALLHEELGDELSSYVAFAVLEAGDPPQVVEGLLGFPLLGSRSSSCTFGDPGYTQAFELIEELEHSFEIVFVLSDDGFGVEVFIPKDASIDRRLLAMCEAFAVPAQRGDPP
jgi:hypothetical protein